jgi:hypothetical protein
MRRFTGSWRTAIECDLAYGRTTSVGQQEVLATHKISREANNELFIFRREQGQWKIHRYMFAASINTDGHAAYPSAVAQLEGEGDLTEDLSGARAHGSRIHEPENMSQSIPKNVRPANSGSLRAGNITTFYNAVSSKRPCLMINQKPFVLD